tara:strand:- start:1013 stop:2302 length:1290 start_codon:yes stop_codon:yes gene_type:complete
MAIDWNAYVRNYAPSAKEVGADSLGAGIRDLASGIRERKKFGPERRARQLKKKIAQEERSTAAQIAKEARFLETSKKEEQRLYDLRLLRQQTEAKRRLTGAFPTTPQELLNPIKNKIYNNSLQTSYSDFKESMFNTDGSFKDPSQWGDLNFITGGQAYKNLLSAIPSENRSALEAQDLLNPMNLNSEYQQMKGFYSSQALSDLAMYARRNRLDADDIRELVSSKPGLNQLLSQVNPQELMAAGLGDLAEAQMPKAQPWKEGFVDPLTSFFGWETPGKLARTVITPPVLYAASKKFGPAIIEKGKDLFSSDEILEKATKSKNVKKAKAAKGTLSNLVKIIEKHGAVKSAQRILKKRGWKFAARNIGRILLGTAGVGLTGGLLTAAMGAWSAKDAYDIYNDLKEMDLQEQYDQGIKNNLDETIKASKFYQQ